MSVVRAVKEVTIQLFKYVQLTDRGSVCDRLSQRSRLQNSTGADLVFCNLFCTGEHVCRKRDPMLYTQTVNQSLLDMGITADS